MGKQKNSLKKRKPNPLNQYNVYIKYSGLAFQMLAIMALATWGGIALDDYMEFEFPVFTLTFILIALIGIIIYIIKSVSEDKF